MSQSEPTGYENEPDEIFTPLPGDLYPSVFHIEMENKKEDCTFYEQILKENCCQKILELGCGTGRIQEHLFRAGFDITGIDCSLSMLDFSKNSRSVPVAQMDMRCLGFKPVFDAVIIPYNTLNLLQNETAISLCLSEIKQVISPTAVVVLHLFCPDTSLVETPGKRHFQFSLFDPEPNKKLIRETIRVYHSDTSILSLEERYKIRSFINPAENKNYSHTLQLAAFSHQKWKSIFDRSGYKILTSQGDFSGSSFTPGSSNSLLISLKNS